jgi:hypothetical protein
MQDYLHNHPQFADLIRIVALQQGIDPSLVEKDYWIMHCLYGLQKLNMKFELKGGTSLSKGHKIIGRFSEDIDIRIDPPCRKAGGDAQKPDERYASEEPEGFLRLASDNNKNRRRYEGRARYGP